MSDTTSVLFVCLGNICRSPLAEGIFTHMVRERGLADRFKIDSCGTGDWHVGKPPDPRSVLVASTHGIDLTTLRARQFDASSDPINFDLLIPMDAKNQRDIIELGSPSEQVKLMRSFDPSTPMSPDVPDPYYGGDDGFEKVYQMLFESCDGLLTQIIDLA